MISTIGITTADRPEPLERCLWSLAKHAVRPSASVRLIVVDASRQPDNEALGRAAAASVQAATDLPITFIGRRERLALRRALRGICRDSVLEFAFRPGASGNRNVILLLASGEHVLLVDDDIIADVWQPRSVSRAMSLGGHVEERSIAFHRRREDVCRTLVRSTVNLLDAHDAVLGRTVEALASSRPANVTRRNACTFMREAARGDRPSVVRMTFTGIAGDAGTSYPDRLLFSRGTWKSALEKDPVTFATAFTFREVCKVSSRYVLMHHVNCMAACMGVANTYMPPPFVPTGRNEDGLFGATLAAMDARAVSCYVPYAVIHASSRPPRYAVGRFPSASEARSADLLMSLIQPSATAVGARDPRRRLIVFGELLRDLARMRPRRFVSAANLAILKTREMEVQAIEGALADDSYPDYWRRAMRSFRRTLLDHLHDSSWLLPVEFRGATPAAGYRDFRQFVRLAGELYIAWPSIWSSVRANPRRLQRLFNIV